MRITGAVATALVLLAALAGSAAAADPALYMDLGHDAHPSAYVTRDWHDTLSVRVWVQLEDYPTKVEGVEFFVAFDCSVTAACAVKRSVDVVSFAADTSLIGSVDQRLCDDICACTRCETPSHFRLHFRTDRLSSIPPTLKASVGTLHVRTSVPTKPADLHFEMSRLWVFGDTPLETRIVEIGKGNTARFGGYAASGATAWGTLRRIYR